MFILVLLGISLPTPSDGSAFADILKFEVLDGTNYVDWKQMIDMFLSFYGYKVIICVDEPPKMPKAVTDFAGKDQYKQELSVYNSCKVANDISKSYVLCGLTRSLRMTYFHTATVKKKKLDKLY